MYVLQSIFNTELRSCEAALGEGVGVSYHLNDIPDPILRAARRLELERRRDAALSSLDALKAAEDAHHTSGT